MISRLAHPWISSHTTPPSAARPRTLAVVLLALAGLVEPSFGCGVAAGSAKVAAVTDRLEIRLEDGRLVRLAGLDIPGPTRVGFDAATPAQARLAEEWIAKSITIEPIAPRPDRWGRWLADLTSAKGTSASMELLSAGLARVRPEFETRDCEAERLAAEAAARAASLGLWNDPNSILDASDLDGLRINDGRFVIIEGAVRRVGAGRSRVYLDFGRRDGFTVVVARKAEPALQRRGVVLSALEGKIIRVRGVLEDRLSPRIELADPQMIERIEGAAKSRPGG